MKIGLFIKYENVDSNFEKEMIEKINSHGHSFDNENPDAVFVVGGDGSFLKAVQKYLFKLDKTCFVCFKKGKLGFFSNFLMEEIDEVLSNLDKDVYKKHQYRLLKAKMNNEIIYAVNEIRIENPFHTLTSEVYVNDTFLENYRGNGLLVSTSLGSTAYNKSLSGAVIDTSLEVLQLNEIAPINNRLYTSLHSPLVMSGDSKIVFKGDFDDIVVGYDHLVKKDFNSNMIEFSLSHKKVSILRKADSNHIKKLNESFVSRG